MIIWSIALAELSDPSDQARVGTIFERYQNAMYWTAYEILKNAPDAEDAVMNAAYSMCRNFDDFKSLPEKVLIIKIIRVVKNAAIDLSRKNKAHQALSLDEQLIDKEDIPDPSESELLAEDFDGLQRHVLKLERGI